MKHIFLLVFGLSLIACSSTASEGLQIGQKAPGFNLKNIDESMVDLQDYTDQRGVIVIFSCNHCPYVKFYEERMQQLHENMAEKGFPVVAINPNDEVAYPEDGFSYMQERAEERGFTFAYLRDESQEVARAYGALKTPHVYLLENVEGEFVCRYIGAIDDNVQRAEAVEVRYVEDAIAAIAKGEKPDPAETKAIGCSVKWKKK